MERFIELRKEFAIVIFNKEIINQSLLGDTFGSLFYKGQIAFFDPSRRLKESLFYKGKMRILFLLGDLKSRFFTKEEY